MRKYQLVVVVDAMAASDALLFVPYADPLARATLLRRRDRFTADVVLLDQDPSNPALRSHQREVAAHCVNPGRMEAFVRPGAEVWVSVASTLGPGRHTRRSQFTLELIRLPSGVLCACNTMRPNVIVKALLETRTFPGLSDWTEMATEKMVPCDGPSIGGDNGNSGEEEAPARPGSSPSSRLPGPRGHGPSLRKRQRPSLEPKHGSWAGAHGWLGAESPPLLPSSSLASVAASVAGTPRPPRADAHRSRLDFWVKEASGVEHWIEVKSCHLVGADGWGYFPDSVSARAAKHVAALQALAGRPNHRATVVFVVQRGDCANGVRPSDWHDPAFAAACRRAAGLSPGGYPSGAAHVGSSVGVGVSGGGVGGGGVGGVGARGGGEGGTGVVEFRAFQVGLEVGGAAVLAEVPVDLGPYGFETVAAEWEANRPFTGWLRTCGSADTHADKGCAKGGARVRAKGRAWGQGHAPAGADGGADGGGGDIGCGSGGGGSSTAGALAVGDGLPCGWRHVANGPFAHNRPREPRERRAAGGGAGSSAGRGGAGGGVHGGAGEATPLATTSRHFAY